MEMQEIEVRIDQDGKVEISVRGMKGEKCLEITAELEETLGGQILLREMTPEASEGSPTEIDQVNQPRLQH
jgi:hypothetical protein